MNTIITRRSILAIGTAAVLTPYQSLRAAPSAGELAADIDIVRDTLALHPGLYRYQTTYQADERLQKLKHDYAVATTLDEQFLLLSAFTATIRCGHTHCNPYNQKKAVVQPLFERSTRLPFEFKWLDDRMVVLADRSDLGLPPDTEIRSIDGEAPARLLNTLVGYARADGSNDAKRVAEMAMQNIDRFGTFDIFSRCCIHPGAECSTSDTAPPRVARLTPPSPR
jgi:hypothetical protein